jgi:hypothetical protein
MSYVKFASMNQVHKNIFNYLFHLPRICGGTTVVVLVCEAAAQCTMLHGGIIRLMDGCQTNNNGYI